MLSTVGAYVATGRGMGGTLNHPGAGFNDYLTLRGIAKGVCLSAFS